MKTILLLCLALCAVLHAADPVYVTAGATKYDARQITNTAAATVTGTLIAGGLGDAPDASWSGKVVLLDRGTLTFAAKVKAVADAGGLAVVIADNVMAELTTWTIAPSTSTLPAVSVTKADGVALKAKAGMTVRVGPAVSSALPDPLGHKDEYLTSDGEKFVFAKFAPVGLQVAIASDAQVGEKVSFSVSADGSAPLSFQWMKDGQNISSATTAVLSIASVTASDAGSYVCQVSNDKGTATSPPHNLTVK